MRDDLAPPNLGQCKRDFDAEFFWKTYRVIEQQWTRVLSKGPMSVSTLTADEIVVDDIQVGDISISGDLTIDGLPFAPVTISDTPPTGVGPGAMWWESDTGRLYINYDDGSSVQWVVANAVSGFTGPQGPAGPAGADSTVPGPPGPAGPVGTTTEIVSLAPTANQNNYATGAAISSGVNTLIDITPTVSMVLTGISTTSWETGKRFTIRNATSRLGANARAIIIPRNSALSSAANRLQYPGAKQLPLILLPEETADFYFNGTDLRLLRSMRPLTLAGYFDWVMNGQYSGGGWYSGTNANTFYASQYTDAAGNPYSCVYMTSGTTATGWSAFIDNGATHRTGAGALLSLSRVALPALSTATDEFTARVGYTERSSAPPDEICWIYNRTVATDWQTRTNSNSTATNTTITGLTVTAGATPIFGVFVNGDGTRVEFFYSNDDGVTYTFTTTAHTTNIPTGTARTFGYGGSVIKTVGTAEAQFRMLYTGSIGWM